MEQIRAKGIVLSAIDYKEKDKKLNIFTLECGKITAILKGVKAPNAKLKFASQVFCFAQFELVRNGEFYVITQVDLIDTFYSLTSNYDKFLRATSMLKVCDKILKYEKINNDLFLVLINSLNVLVNDNILDKIIVCKFIIETLKSCGFGLNFYNCINCKCKLYTAYFNQMLGEFYCDTCNKNYIFIDNQELMALQQLDMVEFDELKSLKIDFVIDKIFDLMNYELKRVIN